MKRPMMSSAIASLLALTSTGLTAHAQLDTARARMKPETKTPFQISKIKDKSILKTMIDTHTLRAKLQETFSFFDFAQIKVGYLYDVRAAFNDGLYARYDRFYVEPGYNLGSDIEVDEANPSDFGVGFSRKKGFEFQFIRHYEDYEEAAREKIHFVDNIPSTAARAKSRLTVGEYFSMKFPMNLHVTGRFLSEVAPQLQLGLEAKYMLAADFQMHVLKLDENRLRVQLIGFNQKEKSLSVGSEVGMTMKLLKHADVKPIEFRAATGKTSAILVDYIVDLSNARAAQAYDNLFTMADRRKQIWNVFDPRNALSTDEFRKPMMVDLEAMDTLARAENSGVKRSFKESSDSKYSNQQLKLKLGVFEAKAEKECSTNEWTSIPLENGKDQPKYYSLRTCKTRNESGSVWNWMSLSEENRRSTIFTANEKFELQGPVDHILSYERKETAFSPNDYQATLSHIRASVTPEIFSQLGLPAKVDSKINNAGIYFQLVIHPNAILGARTRSAAEMKDLFMRYMESFNQIELAKDLTKIKNDMMDDQFYKGYLANEATKSARLLGIVFSNDKTPNERFLALDNLGKIELFKRVGTRFLLEQLEKNDLEKNIRFDFIMNATNMKEIVFKYGDRRENKIYDRWLLAKSLMENGDDMRLQAETLPKLKNR